MRNYFAWACATFLLGFCVFGQQLPGGTSQPAKPTAQADLTNLLDAKIKAEWQAIKNKDQKAYGELLTDDYVAVEADGGGERYKWKALSELHESRVTDYTLSFLKVTTPARMQLLSATKPLSGFHRSPQYRLKKSSLAKSG